MNKRPDLLVLIAVWEFLSAIGVLVPIVAVLGIMWFVPVSTQWGTGSWGFSMPRIEGIIVAVLGIVIIIWLAYFVLAVAGGIGLLQGKEWGRIFSIVHAALSMFWVPVGTIIGILVLIYLVKPEVRDYFLSGEAEGVAEVRSENSGSREE